VNVTFELQIYLSFKPVIFPEASPLSFITLQSFIFLSSDAESNKFPSFENFTCVTGLLCADKISFVTGIYFTLQVLIAQSTPPVTMNPRVGWESTVVAPPL